MAGNDNDLSTRTFPAALRYRCDQCAAIGLVGGDRGVSWWLERQPQGLWGCVRGGVDIAFETALATPLASLSSYALRSSERRQRAEEEEKH